MIDNQYISIDPNIAFGKPCISGTRISVELILEFLSFGHTIDDLLEYHPQLTREQIQAASILPVNVFIILSSDQRKIIPLKSR
jgi:uncharacterized protein (DUF433 family)